jgi:isoquinoline 1-oxidoreductase beta subunit
MSRPASLEMALENVSRRGFVAGLGGALVLAVALSESGAARAEKAPKYGADADRNGWRDDPRLFLAIDPAGLVTLTSHRQEMGQGIKTSLGLLVADELEADLGRMRIVQADGDDTRYGSQDTDGSRSMRHSFLPMRRVGAAARMMLEQAAARRWAAPVTEVQARNHQLVHLPTGRTLGFGEVAAAAAVLPVPDRDSVRLKSPQAFRYIGKEGVRGVDLADMTVGAARYGIDVRIEGLLYAVVARPASPGGTVARYDATAALKVPGVVKVVALPPAREGPNYQPMGGVAVVARNTWAAIKGREALVVEWNPGPNGDYDSRAYRRQLEAAVAAPGQVAYAKGDIDAALAGAARRVTGQYYLPHLAHAPMEPPNATVRATPAGGWEAWTSVQDPQAARDVLAFAVGAKVEDVTVHVTLLGGGFGRKSMPDFVAEAGMVSRAIGGAPVKLTWTREDDLTHDYYHTVSVERLEAGLDASGKVVAWRHRSAAPTLDSSLGPDTKHENADELGMGVTNSPFDIPVVRLENPEALARTRIGWFRSVSNIPHAFAVQSFVAELAAAAGRDPRDFLLDLIGPARKMDPRSLGDTANYEESPVSYPLDTGRLRWAIERASERIGWGRGLPTGHGLGIAAQYSFMSYAACAIEVAVGGDGSLEIPRVDLALDCGPVVNPDRVRAQAEGAVIMGLGVALSGAISFRNGRAEQNNFDTYPVPRMPAAPREIHVHLAEAGWEGPLGGVGEPCMPPVAPALCNAIFAAVGRRIRDLPIGRQLAS